VLGKKTQKHNVIVSFLSMFDPYNIYPSPPGHATTKPLGKQKQFLKKYHCFLQCCKCNSVLDLEKKKVPDSFFFFFGLLCNGCDEMQIMHFNLVMACFLIAVAAATAGYSITESASICCKQKKKLAMKLLMHQPLLLILH